MHSSTLLQARAMLAPRHRNVGEKQFLPGGAGFIHSAITSTLLLPCVLWGNQ